MPSNDKRGSAWSITINNPIPADEENIAVALQRGWKVDGQKERGKEGTLHYQLIVKTPQVRFSAVKKQFPRAHIELARNVVALENYVNKEETREGALPSTSEMYPSMSKLWDMFYDYLENKNLMMAKENWQEEKWLSIFDEFVMVYILKGYHIETMAVNPQVRSCVKKFGREIIIRSQLHRQTDRQTDSDNMSQSTITQEECQSEEEQE